MKFLLLTLAITFTGNSAFALSLPNQAFQESQALDAYRQKILANLYPELAFVKDKGGVEETHKLFPGSSEAVLWAEQVASRIALSFGAKKFTVLPVSDPRYPILQAQIHDLWLAFVDLFPEETKGLNEPPVVLIDSEVVNAFVPKYLLEEKKIAHTVVVLTSLLDAAGGADKRELLSGVIAHEIAHSVFRHVLSSYQVKINRFYNSDENRLGFKAASSPALDAEMEKWKQAAILIGDLTKSELKNLPSYGMAKPLTLRVWNQLSLDLFDSSSACWLARDSFSVWSSYQRSSDFYSSFSIRSVDLGALSLTSDELETNTRTCLNGKKANFIALLSKVIGIPAEVLENMPDLRELANTFANAPDSVTGFQNIVEPIRKDMVEIENRHDMEKIGLFTYEEHADDISLIVHRKLGWKPTALSDFFRMFMGAEDVKRCDSIVATGILPPGGSFSDPHRATCYRIAHLQDLEAEASKYDIREFAKIYVKATTGEK
jgi:hypothetical protein